ncbi:hypothetical protein QQF64_024090 [Cirrhinus molitorella]|uniref:AIG1-type G domain-containing protein n=1 Tax=Cirrhinus molitorella TaxID=172907 RepID=A0ABR3NKP4_9TELE
MVTPSTFDCDVTSLSPIRLVVLGKTGVGRSAAGNTKMKPEMLMEEIGRSVYLSSPGPHAFLIVIRVTDRFTEQEEEEISQQMEMTFGQEVLKYSIIHFTHGDWLKEESIETIMERFPALRRLAD